MSNILDLDNVLKEIKQLMRDERIRPEPQYKCFAKYLVSCAGEEFLNNDEIFHLIDLHGLELRNEIKYWIDLNNLNNKEESSQNVPVLDPQHFCINGMNDVRAKLKELPSEWTLIQITKKFSVNDVLRKQEGEDLTGIHITRLACGDLSERIPPYSVTINEGSNCVDNVLNQLRTLIKQRREFFTLGRRNKKLVNKYYKTNSDLMSFINELESYLLKHWICLFRGRLEDVNLEREFFSSVKNLIASFCEKEDREFEITDRCLDIIYQATLTADLMKSRQIFSVLRSALYKKGENVNVRELKLLVENIKILNLSKDCSLKRATFNPVILILDNDLEVVPWEMISPLFGHPICRISSLHLLYAVFKFHEPHIKNGFRIINIDRTYCLINPDKDLESCEKVMKEFLKKRLPWAEVDFGGAPEVSDLISKIRDFSVYLYCGHGTGMQYLEQRELKRSFVKGLILLFGCGSNIPRSAGGRTPHQNNTYTYISNGCPCIIGCIQDVGSSDADEACKEMLSKLMPTITLKRNEPSVESPTEPDVLKAVVAGKKMCSKYWSKSGFVARGIPCKTAVGDVNELKSLGWHNNLSVKTISSPVKYSSTDDIYLF